MSKKLSKLRCGECGHQGLELRNWKGQRVPWKQYEFVEIISDLYIGSTCPKCDNRGLWSSEAQKLDEVIARDLANGAPHRLG